MEIQKEQSETIIEVLEQYFDNDFISYIPEDDMIFYPLGSIAWEDDIWTISHDYTMITDYIDIRLTSQIVQEIIDCGLDLTVMEGYWTIFNEDVSKVLDLIWEHQIEELSEEKEISFHEAFKILHDKLVSDNEQPLEKNTSLH